MIEETLKTNYHDCLTGKAKTNRGLIPAGLDIYETTSSIIVSRIVIKEECKGNNVGTSIMNDLIAYADSNQQMVALTPSSDFGGNENRLKQFYKRFGFRMTSKEEKQTINYTMIRKALEPGQKRVNENKIKGGIADKLTKKDIADKFNIKVSELEKEIKIGVKVELEHTDSKETAEEIAMDHLTEMPDYYSRLEKMEKESEDFWQGRLKESVARELRKLI